VVNISFLSVGGGVLVGVRRSLTLKGENGTSEAALVEVLVEVGRSLKVASSLSSFDEEKLL
jgi:hypothetical protein